MLAAMLIAIGLLTPQLIPSCTGPSTGLDGVVLPIVGASVGPNPLFVLSAQIASPALKDAAGNLLALVPATVPELDGATGEGGDALAFYRPASPLPSGPYDIVYGPYHPSFQVDGNLEPTPVDAVDRVDLALRIDTRPPKRSSGCGSGGGICDGIDLSTLSVSSSSSGPMLVTATVGGVVLRRIVGSGDLTLERPTPDVPDITSTVTCVTVLPFGVDGTVGTPYDAGCIDPSDTTDARITRTDMHLYACAAVPPTALLTVVLAFLVLRRLVAGRAGRPQSPREA